MLTDIKWNKVYIALGYTDMRLGIDGLAGRVQDLFQLSPFQKEVLFLFCGRKTDRIKGLVWEGDGFVLLYKRLETGKFKWPRTPEEVKEISDRQLVWLLQGLNIYQRTDIKDINPEPVL